MSAQGVKIQNSLGGGGLISFKRLSLKMASTLMTFIILMRLVLQRNWHQHQLQGLLQGLNIMVGDRVFCNLEIVSG